MNRFRSILLSGLVALLMVGMVSAGEVSDVTPGETVDGGISIYLGTLTPEKTMCIPATANECINIGISFSLEWLKDLFR